jgi:MFS family permease
VRTASEGRSSAEVLITLIGGTILVVAFLLWERSTKKPMLELSLFRSRGFSGANQVSFFMYATLIGSIFLMTQFLQTGLGYSPLEAGLRILPWTAVAMIVSPIAGALSDRFGNRPFLIVGMALQALGLGWLAMIAEPGMAYRDLAITLLVAGIGISLVYPTVANAVVGAVPSKEMGIASGTHSALREVGGVFGVAVLASVFAGDRVFGSANEFVDSFSKALWVGAILSVVGIIGAFLTPGLVKSAPAVRPPRPTEMVTEDV